MILAIYNVGDCCRTKAGLPARSLGYGKALAMVQGEPRIFCFAPAVGGELLDWLPTDAQVIEAALKVHR
jgi:hypothetical protein